jgi:hypothetical protein
MTSSYLDEWFDEYNDYMRLYEFFGDRQYIEEATEILNSLKAIVNRDDLHKWIMVKMMSNTIHV